MRPLAGVFVGGASRRMGGQPKGLLPGPDGRTLVERTRDVLEAAGAEVRLVGAHPAYAPLGLPVIADELDGAGPLGGLVALLAAAEGRPVIAIACDMPFVSERTVAALLAVGHTAAPRRDGRWEPLCAVYHSEALAVARRRLAAGQRSLQGLLDELAAQPVEVDEGELVDWDRPEDRR